ncbi:BspA family leucine-rich repeat surface protein, partial [Bernardetia sp.]|uniref:BspA family leucine-rich repeat surface protein n=1 Tax=Bernardetia sp. TaxID=1937974 RepID=UPI0025C53AE6
MRKKYFVWFRHILLSFTFLFFAFDVFGQPDLYSLSGGDATNPNTWSLENCSATQSVAGQIPNAGTPVTTICAGEDVFIPSGATFEVNNLEIYGGLTLQNNARLIVNGTLKIHSTGLLTTTNNMGDNFFFNFRGNITNNGIFRLRKSSHSVFETNPISITNNNGNMQFSESLGSGTCNINSNVTINNGGGGEVQLWGAGGINISTSVTLTNNATTSALAPNYLMGNGSFINNGVVIMRSDLRSDVQDFNNTVNSTFIYDYTSPAGNVRGGAGVNYGSVIFTGSTTGDTKVLSGVINVLGNLTISGGETLNSNNYNIDIQGNWINNGTFTAGTGTVTFDGTTGSQILSGNNSFYDLIIDNQSTSNDFVELTTNDITISNSLILSNGRLRLNNHDLLHEPVTNPVVSSGWVETNNTGRFINKNIPNLALFPVGSNTDYQPVELSTSAFNASVRFGISSLGMSGVGSWFIDNNGTDTNITFKNPQSIASIDASSKVHFYNVSSWDEVAGTSYSTPNYTVFFPFSAGTTEFSVFTPPSNPFITTWNLATAGSGTDQLTFGVATSGIVNYTWQQLPSGASGSGSFSGSTCTIIGLPTGATIRLNIESTNFQRIIINNGIDKNRLIQIDQWGDIAWTSMEAAFKGCTNLTTIGAGATNVPNLGGVSTMWEMFQGCTNFVGDINMNSWDVSGVQTFARAFQDASIFNQPLDNWDVSSGTTFGRMFDGASSFNQDLTWSFNTSTLVNLNMQGMFEDATAFNGDVSGWNTERFRNLFFMFTNSPNFDQDLSSWNVENVNNMTEMLRGTDMSQANYDATLISWASQSVQPLTLGAGGRTYCNAIAERAILTSAPNNWVINGDAVNPACLPSQPIGNRGMYFDGDGGHIEVTSGFVMDYSQGTVELWVKPQYDNAANRQFLIGLVEFSTTKWAYYMNADRSGVTFFDGTTHHQFSHTFEKNKWYHLAFVDDNAGTISLYINGSSTPITTPALKINSVASPVLYIGSNAAVDALLGQIDEVRIFNSVRNAGQIQADMGSPTPNGAVGYWDFEQVSGDAIDVVASNNGTINGALRAIRVTETDDIPSSPTVGSLRWALVQADINSNKDYIDFSIPALGVQTIEVRGTNISNDWLDINHPVFIDGFSQYGSSPNTLSNMTEGSPVSDAIHTIRLIPASATFSNGNGFVITNSNISGSHFRGLQMEGFTASTFYIEVGTHNNIKFTGNHFINSGVSINIDNTSHNSYTIGGTSPAERNIFESSTGGGGIAIISKGNSHTIINNVFGLQPNGTSSTNQLSTAISIQTTGGNNNLIGGTVPNLITNISSNAININAGTGNQISKNSIYNNGSGIVLSGSPVGNANKQAPVITSASTSSVLGTCVCAVGDTIQLFRDNITLPLSNKQGQEYLGSFIITTTNQWEMTTFISAPVIDDYLTTTLTDGSGNTSPFSSAHKVIEINIGAITPTSYCPSEIISVPFTVNGTFDVTQTFTVQLSDASGSFASPTVIGTGASPISATIPNGTPAGIGYRVRVVSSDPIVTSDESTIFTINPLPTATLSASQTTICDG